MDIKISVVITVYNIEAYIGECLDSVLMQSLKEIEVICINDSSTDGSLDVLKEYAVIDGRIKIIDLPQNVGPASARNAGFREARGDYIYQIDGDDLLVDEALQKMYITAKENNLDLLTFSATAFTDNDDYQKNVKNSRNTYARHGTYLNIISGVELMAEFLRENDFLGNLCCNFVRRKFLLDNNILLLEGLRFSADRPFEIYLKAKKAMCIPDILYRRRYRSDSIVTSEKKLIHLESLLCGFMYEFNLWQRVNFSDTIEEQLTKYFMDQWRYILQTADSVYIKDGETVLLPNHKGAKFLYDMFFGNKNNFWTNVYWKPQLIKEINRIKQFDNVIVYGAALKAREVISILEKFDIKDYRIAVTNNEKERFMDGRSVFNIDDLKDISQNSIVLISVKKKNWNEIASMLKRYGFNNYIYVE